MSVDRALNSSSTKDSMFFEILVGKAFLARYQDICDKTHFNGISGSTKALNDLQMEINNDLEDIKCNFNVVLQESTLSIPYSCAECYLKQLIPVYFNFANMFRDNQMNMSDGFEIYQKILTFQSKCLSIDTGFKVYFEISVWFRCVVQEWFRVSESKMMEWVYNAISIDKVLDFHRKLDLLSVSMNNHKCIPHRHPLSTHLHLYNNKWILFLVWNGQIRMKKWKCKTNYIKIFQIHY